jgi:hypothetical protein
MEKLPAFHHHFGPWRIQNNSVIPIQKINEAYERATKAMCATAS